MIEENIKQFFWFINERHMITIKKTSGEPWPWTTDPILQTYKFCNVFRELDKVTIWIRENWREPYANHPNLWFAMCMARQINWPPTLAKIGFPTVWEPSRVVNLIRSAIAQGVKAYTGAYMLLGQLGDAKDKAETTSFHILDPLYKHPPPLQRAKTLQEAFNMLKERPGFGHFLAYEVVTDLRHTHYLENAPDIMTWANAGPGAIRGLNRIWNRPYKSSLSQKQAVEEMRYLLTLSPTYLADHVPALEMRDIEHCLCEHDKRQRVLLGEGKMRSRYTPPGLI